MIRAWLRIVSLFWFVPVSCLCAAPLSLSITAVRNAVLSGDEVFVTATLVNVTAGDVWIDKGQKESDYAIRVTGPAGRPAPESAHSIRLRKQIRISGHARQLVKGEELKLDVEVSRFFDLTVPGTYTIELELPALYGPGAVVRSNVLLLTILPANRDADAAPQTSGGSVGESSGPMAGELSLSIRTDRGTVFSGREIPVVATLINHSKRAISLPIVPAELYFKIDVRDAGGRAAAESAVSLAGRQTELQQQDQLPSRPFVTPVSSGDHSWGEVDVAKLFDLTQPGDYTIQLGFDVPSDLGGGEIRSNRITVRVKRRGL